MKLLETLYSYIKFCQNQLKFIEDMTKNVWLFLWPTVYDKRRQFVFR